MPSSGEKLNSDVGRPQVDGIVMIVVGDAFDDGGVGDGGDGLGSEEEEDPDH